MIKRYQHADRLLVAVDCIIFGFDKNQLRLLLTKRAMEPEKGNWSLIGGFVGKNESLDDAATRVLYKLTGLKNIYIGNVLDSRHSSTFCSQNHLVIERVGMGGVRRLDEDGKCGRCGEKIEIL